MSVKHLSAGSQDVPLQDGKLRLYSMRFCPYAHRIHLILNAKEILHDVVNINLKKKPEWFLEKIPTGKVPALQVDEDMIYESLIIADYLDEKYPQRPLSSKDPLRKAQDRLLIEEFSTLREILFGIYFNPTVEVREIKNLALFKEKLDRFEKELAKRGTHFFSGDVPGMLDYMIWPWCERLDMEKVLGGDDRFNNILQWRKEMLGDPAVKKHYCNIEQHSKFLKGYKEGNYDPESVFE